MNPMKSCQWYWRMAPTKVGLWEDKSVQGVGCHLKMVEPWWTMFCAISCEWLMVVYLGVQMLPKLMVGGVVIYVFFVDDDVLKRCQ